MKTDEQKIPHICIHSLQFYIMCLLFIKLDLINSHCAKIHYPPGMVQVTTMLATSRNALFSGYNHLLITGTDDPSLTGEQASSTVIH